MSATQRFLDQPVEFLKGVGPKKAELFKQELQVETIGDLLEHYPYRYVDRTQFHAIGQLHEHSGEVQVLGELRRLTTVGEGRKRRLVGRLRDKTGFIDLVWFAGIKWLEKSLVVGSEYVAYGRVNAFQGRLNLPHPEMEQHTAAQAKPSSTFDPVYASTDNLNKKGLDVRRRRRIMKGLWQRLKPEHFPENLPRYLIEKFQFPARYDAMRWIHLPTREEELRAARRRLTFEELFWLQLRLLQLNRRRKARIQGFTFDEVGAAFLQFYQDKLPFELTGAQKRVMRDIRRDLGSGVHMNRLLQGDVGSGKTVVGLMAMLLAIDNGFQACLMAPTEILASQHYQALSDYLEGMEIELAFLSGSVKGKKRRAILEGLAEGRIDILIGTHALIEPTVVFHRLGLAITDEQHRFGVAQRAKLWKKSRPHPPHVLVMTATPIPRTLAMTLYGDLDVSIIDELPPGRKAIKTMHYTEHQRRKLTAFVRRQIAAGRQVYIVYPLIEESEKLDLKNLQDGYEAIRQAFPPPDYQISVVHGRMKAADKAYEMGRFVRGETQIMVATTVIEVGVNVPNATVMVIENTERFGLSQLHQLRGRVGRGAEQSYCILMSSFKLSKESRLRIDTMVRTQDGFEIADADLKLRGPGNIEGTQQSGILNFRLADLARDGAILRTAREVAARILDDDPQLEREIHRPLKAYLAKHAAGLRAWSRIS